MLCQGRRSGKRAENFRTEKGFEDLVEDCRIHAAAIIADLQLDELTGNGTPVESAVGVVKLGLAVLITKTVLVPIRLGLQSIFVAISKAYHLFP